MARPMPPATAPTPRIRARMGFAATKDTIVPSADVMLPAMPEKLCTMLPSAPPTPADFARPSMISPKALTELVTPSISDFTPPSEKSFWKISNAFPMPPLKYPSLTAVSASVSHLEITSRCPCDTSPQIRLTKSSPRLAQSPFLASLKVFFTSPKMPLSSWPEASLSCWSMRFWVPFTLLSMRLEVSVTLSWMPSM